MMGLFNENGPCEVIEVANGQFGTVARDWGWDRGSNVLYIDQVWELDFLSYTPTQSMSWRRVIWHEQRPHWTVDVEFDLQFLQLMKHAASLL